MKWLFSGVYAKLKCLCSRTYCPENHVNFTCETEGNCFRQLKIDEYTYEKREIYGCLPKEPSGIVSIFHCKRSSDRKLEERNSVSCCYDRDFCNEDLKPTLKPTEKQPSESWLTRLNVQITSNQCCKQSSVCRDLLFTYHYNNYCLGPAPAQKISIVAIALAISVTFCFLVLVAVVVWCCCRYDIKSCNRIELLASYTT